MVGICQVMRMPTATSVAISSSGRPSSSNMGLNRKTSFKGGRCECWGIQELRSGGPFLHGLRESLLRCLGSCWKTALVRWRIEGVYDGRRYLREFRLHSMEWSAYFSTHRTPPTFLGVAMHLDPSTMTRARHPINASRVGRELESTCALWRQTLRCYLHPVRWDLILWCQQCEGCRDAPRNCLGTSLSHVTARAASPASLVTIFVHVSR